MIRKRRRLVERVADSKPRFAGRLASLLERQPEKLRAAEAVAALMPDFKPVLEDIFMDDEGRLWVQRAVPADTPPFFDIFSDDGDYLGSIRFTFTPAPYRPLWVQHGSIYAVIEDELDVPYVVRGPAGR